MDNQIETILKENLTWEQALYEMNEELSSILYAIELKNAYSGIYRMTGSLQEEGDNNEPLQVFKDKLVVPIDEFTCRMFLGAENELPENIPSRTLMFTVQSDNSIKITENSTVSDLGESKYDPEKEFITLNYSYMVSEKRYEIREKLIRLKDDML